MLKKQMHCCKQTYNFFSWTVEQQVILQRRTHRKKTNEQPLRKAPTTMSNRQCDNKRKKRAVNEKKKEKMKNKKIKRKTKRALNERFQHAEAPTKLNDWLHINKTKEREKKKRTGWNRVQMAKKNTENKETHLTVHETQFTDENGNQNWILMRWNTDWKTKQK